MSVKKKFIVKNQLVKKNKELLRIAVFAGSFDPVTLGHLDIIQRAAAMFDVLWVLVANNSQKRYMFPLDKRKIFVEKAVANVPNVKVSDFEGLTIDFMKQVGAQYLVRGVRNSKDLDFEQSIAWNNKSLYGCAETVLLFSSQEHLSISSSVVRELLMNGVKNSITLSKFIPKIIVPDILRLLR